MRRRSFASRRPVLRVVRGAEAAASEAARAGGAARGVVDAERARGLAARSASSATEGLFAGTAGAEPGDAGVFGVSAPTPDRHRVDLDARAAR